VLLYDNIFPQTLKILDIHILDQQLSEYTLPPSLEKLSIGHCQKELYPKNLPANLKELSISLYDYRLKVGVLPQSLTKLKIEYYNSSIDPFVLPSNLKELKLSFLTHVLMSNCIPPSITSLTMDLYEQTFQFMEPLPNLKSLSISLLNKSIINIISNNTKELKLSFGRMHSDVSLYDTSIERLYLKSDIPSKPSTLHAGLLPQSLKKLYIKGIDITSTDLIPASCFYLDTDIHNLNNDLLPSSIKYINKQYIK